MSSLEREQRIDTNDSPLGNFRRWVELTQKLIDEGWLKRPRMVQKPPTTIGQWTVEERSGRKVRYGNRLY